MVDKMCDIYCLNLGKKFKRETIRQLDWWIVIWISNEQKMITYLETFGYLGIYFLEA
jgi:hypothetical protein